MLPQDLIAKFEQGRAEKHAWKVLVQNCNIRILHYSMKENNIPWPQGDGTKATVAEQLFKHLETLPTMMEIDAIREFIKEPSKHKWLEENWGNKDFDKHKKAQP